MLHLDGGLLGGATAPDLGQFQAHGTKALLGLATHLGRPSTLYNMNSTTAARPAGR